MKFHSEISFGMLLPRECGAKGKHSLYSIECLGAAVDMSAVLGTFDVASALYGRTAVTQALDKASKEACECFENIQAEPAKENAVAVAALWSELSTLFVNF